tara:strand:- start:528 stop:935 length:408 start_codon:yes stop_codon:yes gene_type:complete
MAWFYDDKLFEETPEDYQGFVYEIVDLYNNKRYIGKKNFWKPKILPKNSKRSRRIRTRVESDWKTYYSSNKELQLLAETNDEVLFERIILRLCKTKGEMSYYEAKLQFERDVLLRDDYYNEFIGCKIHSRHLKRK